MSRAAGTDGAGGTRPGAPTGPRRRPVDPTRIRLVSLGVYLAVVVLMVLVAGPASAAPATADAAATSSDLPAVVFTALVGGGLVVRSVLRRGRLQPVRVRTHERDGAT